MPSGYSGTAKPQTSRRSLTNRAIGDDDDYERQYEGDGIVGDDEVI